MSISMNIAFRISLFSISLLVTCSAPKPLDLLITNGVIHTMNEDQPQASSVGIIDGKIVYVGDEDGTTQRITDHTRVLNLNGLTMTPGWIEGHGHFMGMGYHKLQLDLRHTKPRYPNKRVPDTLQTQFGLT